MRRILVDLLELKSYICIARFYLRDRQATALNIILGAVAVSNRPVFPDSSMTIRIFALRRFLSVTGSG